MYLYQTDPQDYFAGMMPIREALAYLGEPDGEENVGFKNVLDLVVAATYAAATYDGSYWEGDYNFMHVFVLPDPESCGTRLGLIWKQANNGSTFIFSPLFLPWINEKNLLPAKPLKRG